MRFSVRSIISIDIVIISFYLFTHISIGNGTLQKQLQIIENIQVTDENNNNSIEDDVNFINTSMLVGPYTKNISTYNNNGNFDSNWTVYALYLFTRDYSNATYFEKLDPRNITSIKSSHFSSRQTYLIIHGFLGFGLEEWVITLKNKLLKKEDCNVISVSWPAGTKWFLPTYITAADRVPHVGNNVAELLRSLLKFKGLFLHQVHCIGHSLGAHVCGFCGKSLKQKIGRISGLDPAGPKFNNVNTTQRLDKKDAIYVDVIHTNECNNHNWIPFSDCYGINENIGHSDFYPNGGMHQPNCSQSSIYGVIGCSHEIAYTYYIESLDYGFNNTYFYARPCDNWFNYIVGFCPCGITAQYMGFNVNSKINGVFYLETRSQSPFAMTDPVCSDNRGLNILIIIGYVLISIVLAGFSILVLIVVARNIKVCLNYTDNTVYYLETDDSAFLIHENRSANVQPH